MHGLIVNQLRQYVVQRHDRETWEKLRVETGVGLDEGPIPINAVYPDEEVVALVSAASAATGTPLSVLLEDFGAFIAPALLRVYEPLIRREWSALDIVEKTEDTIHTVVRRQDGIALPPHLKARRVSPGEVEVEYTSPRRLCDVARGIVRGIAEERRELVQIEQPECMLRGDARCLIRVTTPDFTASGDT